MQFAFPEFRIYAIIIILFSVMTCSVAHMAELSVTWVQKALVAFFSSVKNECFASDSLLDVPSELAVILHPLTFLLSLGKSNRICR